MIDCDALYNKYRNLLSSAMNQVKEGKTALLDKLFSDFPDKRLISTLYIFADCNGYEKTADYIRNTYLEGVEKIVASPDWPLTRVQEEVTKDLEVVKKHILDNMSEGLRKYYPSNDTVAALLYAYHHASRDSDILPLLYEIRTEIEDTIEATCTIDDDGIVVEYKGESRFGFALDTIHRDIHYTYYGHRLSLDDIEGHDIRSGLMADLLCTVEIVKSHLSPEYWDTLII